MRIPFLVFLSVMLLAQRALFAENSMAKNETTKKATFAGGCFWCMQPPFDKLPGVVSTTVGYTGGTKDHPTYEEVSAGGTGHAESLEVAYDPSKIRYDQLLDVFWKNIDPTTKDAQFVDIGRQYRSAIFYHDEDERREALASKERLEKSGRYSKPIATEIVSATKFYPAEEHHQKYYQKNPIRYKFYRFASGRDQYLKKIWGKEAGHEP